MGFGLLREERRRDRCAKLVAQPAAFLLLLHHPLANHDLARSDLVCRRAAEANAKESAIASRTTTVLYLRVVDCHEQDTLAHDVKL